MGCVVWFFEVFRTRQQILTRVARVKKVKKGQILDYGFLLLLIQIPILTALPRLKTPLREPITENIGRLVVGSNQLCADEPFPTLVTRVGTLFPQILLGSISKENGSHLV